MKPERPLTILARAAQKQLRHGEAAKQASILDALPACIALLDPRGLITSVNETWRRFAYANAMQGSGYGVGVNYLEICHRARGEGASHAHQAACGIRSVLSGGVSTFSMEYPCHSATEQHWFLLKVTALADDRSDGAVVMHIDVTAEKQASKALQDSELRFRQMAESIRDVFFLREAGASRMLYVSPAYEDIWMRSCKSLYANPDAWIEAIHPDDQASMREKYKNGMSAGTFEYEYRIVRPDGSIRWIKSRGFPVRDSSGKVVRIAGTATDITDGRLTTLELRESERRFSDLLRNVELVSIMLDHEGRITYCNEYLLRVTGWSHADVIGKDWLELFIPPESRAAKAVVFADLLANSPDVWHHENEIVSRSGDRRLIRWNNSVLRSVAGNVIGTASIGEDITDQKRSELKIKRLNRVYAVLSGINSLIVRVQDRDILFKEACEVAVEHGRFKMAWIGVVDRSAQKIVPIASAGAEPEFVALIKDSFSLREDVPIDGTDHTARAVREKRAIVLNEIEGDTTVFLTKDRIERGIFSMAILPLMVSNEALGVLALYADESEFFDEKELKLLTELASNIALATDHIDKRQRLDYLFYYDVLTGLANRSLFLERVGQYVRSATGTGQTLALFLIDLERFKNINDTLGQAAGDVLLKKVAEWLTVNVGDAHLLARVGADRFAVVLTEVSKEGDVARLLDKTIQAFLEHPFQVNDTAFRIAAKVGVALFPEDGVDADTLFKKAEAALKKAKMNGERYLFYTQKMTEAVAIRLTLENQLRQALDNGQFVLHYQPKINLASGQLTGVEALIRWNDPRTGLVPPGQFISILEETGLIHDVGRWALHTAIDDYLRWNSAGLANVRIAVNVSAVQLRNRDFITEIRRAVDIDPRAASGLELEITESLIMEDVKRGVEILQAIRLMGVSIAIDDFGTGFSSLSYLTKLPVDTLKIDRSFVMDLVDGPEGLALVSTIITLAHSLKLKVVAEGVETEEQARLLRLLNCDEFQGYLFSKPVPREIFETRFLSRHGQGGI
ncbi:MAG TPA: EAL domain-containing protein [Steroidobacteraceae bacterium]|jgi:diguanylate cyclase (GGDEF)-like protein/PAS domain S-box-containing protein|nr:EAL domain-containing protein [Steroidobacteraceae bacterium]